MEKRCQALLRAAWAEHGLEPVDRADKKRRYKTLKLVGQFRCTSRHAGIKAWSSHYTWLTVDLHKLSVGKRWTQKCRICGDQRSPYIAPGAFVVAVEGVVMATLEWTLGIARDDPLERWYSHEADPEHPATLCEKCKWGRGCNCSGGRDEGVDAISAQVASMTAGGGLDFYSPSADMFEVGKLRSFGLWSRAQLLETTSAANNIRLALVDASLIEGRCDVDFLVGGSRGKDTSIGPEADLDIVIHLQAFQPEEEFVQGVLARVDGILSSSGRIEIWNVRVLSRSLSFDCRCSGALVSNEEMKVDLLVGGLDESGARLTQPNIMTRENQFWYSPSFNHLQIRYFAQMPREFKALCRMAKRWFQDGSGVRPKQGKSYMLELCMLKVWTDASDAEKMILSSSKSISKFQRLFHEFLRLISNFHEARIVFEHFYQRSDVPVHLTSDFPHIISISNPFSDTGLLWRNEDAGLQALRSAAAHELDESYQRVVDVVVELD